MAKSLLQNNPLLPSLPPYHHPLNPLTSMTWWPLAIYSCVLVHLCLIPSILLTIFIYASCIFSFHISCFLFSCSVNIPFCYLRAALVFWSLFFFFHLPQRGIGIKKSILRNRVWVRVGKKGVHSGWPFFVFSFFSLGLLGLRIILLERISLTASVQVH